MFLGLDRTDIRYLAPVLLLSAVLSVVGLDWGVTEGVLHTWAVDTIDHDTLFRAVGARFSDGWHTRYPPLHFYLLSIIYSPFILLHAASVIDLGTGEYAHVLFYLGRGLTILMAQGTLVFLFATAREIGIRRIGGAVACLVLALSPTFVYLSKTLNLDVPYLFWFAGSLFYFVRALEHHRLSDHVLFITFAVFSVTTKDQAYGLYLITVPFLWFRLYRHLSDERRRGAAPFRQLVTDRRVWIPAVGGVVLFGLIHNVVFNWSGFWAHVEQITGAASQSWRQFSPTPLGQAKLGFRSLRVLGFTTGWPMFGLLCLGFLSLARVTDRRKFLAGTLIPCISYYVTFIAVVGYVYDRFLLPIVLVLGLVTGNWLATRLEQPRWRHLSISLAAGIFGYSLLYGVSVDVLMLSDGRDEVQGWMERNVARDVAIMRVGIPHYHPFLAHWSQIVDVRSNDLSPAVLDEEKPDYVITSSADGQALHRPGTNGYRFFEVLQKEDGGYELVLENRGEVPFSLLDLPNIGELGYTNLNKINPRIRIFERKIGSN